MFTMFYRGTTVLLNESPNPPMMTTTKSLRGCVCRRTMLASVAIVLALPSPARAQLTVLMSGGFAAAYQHIIPGFEQTTNIRITTASGASQGTGPETIAAQLARGAEADVVIMSRAGLMELAAAGRLMPGTSVDLATTPLGLSVRAGAAKPDISTTDAFTRALVSAGTVVMPTSTSGIYLKTELFPRLGLTDKIAATMTSRTSQAMTLLANGGAAVAIAPVSELLGVSGTDYVGELPPEIQLVQPFSAAIIAGSKRVDAAKRLIAFLASDSATAAIRNSGMQPVRRRPPN